MNLDYLANDFYKKLTELVNNSQLPPTLAYYILKDVMMEVSEVAAQSRFRAECELYGNQEKQTVTQEIPINIVGQNKDE